MTKLFLRLLNTPFFILLALLASAFQTSFFMASSLPEIQPDFLFLGVLWCALFRNWTEGGTLSLVLGEIAEIHSGAPRGLFLICNMALFLGLRLVSRYLLIENRLNLFFLIFFSLIFWKLCSFAVLALLDISGKLWPYAYLGLIPSGIIHSVLGIAVFRGLKRLDWITYKDPKAREILQDELHLHEEGL